MTLTGELGIADYRCPATGGVLRLQGDSLVSDAGHRFPIEDGVPNLVWPPELSEAESRTQASYDRSAEQVYDEAMKWQFAALHEDEDRVRESMLDELDLQPQHRVLEVGCGTGRDSYRIARRLDHSGALHMQDLSPAMVRACMRRMQEHDRGLNFRCRLDYSVSNASHLPYPDDFFDRLFHFGGFNEFTDHQRAASEFMRVVKPGSLVVFGDESVAPWLRGAEFGAIVIANNPLFDHPVPLQVLPASAREVSVRWVLANCFYLISFRKGDGPPPLNLDLPHKGWRGGTMRSRYYGVMEGVRPETKELVRQAAARAGLSVHEWLDRTVRDRAIDESESGSKGEDEDGAA